MSLREHTRIRLGILVVLAVTAGFAPRVHVQNAVVLPTTVRCVNLSGSYIGAPKWAVEADGATGQEVLLEFKEGRSSKIVWRKDGVAYSEAEGIGLGMRSGFLIFVPSEEYIETYVYNAGTTELLFSATRSGSARLPNAVKAFRGTCVGAAAAP